MDDIERITVSLPLSEELRDAVAAGEYPSVEAAVGAAVEAWEADRMVARIGVERLREHWDRGIASGDPQPLDVADLKRRIRLRAGAMRRAHGVDR